MKSNDDTWLNEKRLVESFVNFDNNLEQAQNYIKEKCQIIHY